MKIKKNILLCVLLLFSCKLFSQDRLFYEKNFSAFAAYFLENYGIVCKEPTSFSDLNKYYITFKIREDPATDAGFIYGPIFQSDDKDCLLAFYSINTTYVPEGQINHDIRTALGLWYSYHHPLNKDTAKVDLYDFTTVITGKKAHKMFNADKFYIYDIPGGDSVFFKDKELEDLRKKHYPYCTGLAIHKEGRIVTKLKIFFSEKGKKKEDEYINMLAGKIWYNDDFQSKALSSFDIKLDSALRLFNELNSKTK